MRIAKRLCRAVGELFLISALVWAVTLPLVSSPISSNEFRRTTDQPAGMFACSRGALFRIGRLRDGCLRRHWERYSVGCATRVYTCSSAWPALYLPWAYCWIPHLPEWWVTGYYAALGVGIALFPVKPLRRDRFSRSLADDRLRSPFACCRRTPHRRTRSYARLSRSDTAPVFSWNCRTAGGYSTTPDTKGRLTPPAGRFPLCSGHVASGGSMRLSCPTPILPLQRRTDATQRFHIKRVVVTPSHFQGAGTAPAGRGRPSSRPAFPSIRLPLASICGSAVVANSSLSILLRGVSQEMTTPTALCCVSRSRAGRCSCRAIWKQPGWSGSSGSLARLRFGHGSPPRLPAQSTG